LSHRKSPNLCRRRQPRTLRNPQPPHPLQALRCLRCHALFPHLRAELLVILLAMAGALLLRRLWRT
jgi:hypothetical protein